MSVPTMADVARLAGVSKKTVSNYVNGYPYFRPETRRRIEAAIAELDYKVNISARNLSSGRTGAISLVVPEIAHPYFAELAQAVVSAAQRHGLSVVVEVTDGDADAERAVLRGDRGRAVDGLLLHAIGLVPADLEHASTAIPTVIMGDRVHRGRFDFVTVANEAGAHAITQHLIAAGRRRIVALGMERSATDTAASLRLRGYERALSDAGVAVDDDLLVGPISWNRASGATAIAMLLDAGVRFDAVLGLSDALALGALNELQRRGHDVPGEISVAGFDDVDEAALAYPPLTSVDSGRAWIAERAVERLIQRRDEPQLPTEVLIADFRLAIRDSA